MSRTYLNPNRLRASMPSVDSAGKTCGQCEYFDRHYGDCLNSNSDRFQTTGERAACSAFYPDTTANDHCVHRQAREIAYFSRGEK
ncbi:protein of unknown function [Pararobbsia alpina]|uniref:hypothetical protein n=1 Tax=Pararobbsia alpina TaxID=621374 RepID=UPI0039A5D445